MNAKDLMVGDWVCTEHDSTPRQIDWIRGGEVGLFWNKVVTPPYLIPIPLTPEILDKNGFKDMGFFGKLEIGPWRLICDSGNLAVLHEGREEEYINIPISYVHELQHALRLCGIDKEIELLKKDKQ